MEKILIINDNKTGVLAYEKLLNRAGYNVVTALDGLSGIKVFEDEEPDLVLMDIIMPGMNGFETARKIREKKEKLHIPILFISAYQSDMESKIKGLNIGGNDYLAEPYEIDELQLKIKVLLKGKKYYEELLEVKNRLEKSEEKYRRILDTIEEGYFEIDLRGNMLFFNNSTCRIFGYPRDELMGMNNREYTTRESAKKFFKLFSNIHETGKPSKLVEYDIIKKDGSKVILELSAGLLTNSNSEPTGFHGVVRDVTKNKNIERELLKKNFAIETSINATVIAGLDGKISYANKSFLNMWRYDHIDEVLGKNVSEFWQSDAIDINIMDELKELGFWFGEISVVENSGSHFNVILSAAMIKDENNNPTDIVSTFVDISMRKNAELALKENEAKLNERNKIMERDLKIAQVAQNEIIKRETPDVKFLKIDYRFYPMEKVGGDYFAFFPYEDNSTGFFICDVSGHGVASALFLTLIKSVSDRMSKIYGSSPSDFISNLNKELIDDMPSYYLTGIYGYFEWVKNFQEVKFTYTNGGHPEPILIRKNNKIEILKNKNIVIGIKEDEDFQEESVKMFNGDRIFFFTDGIPETTNKKKKSFGDQKNYLELFKNIDSCSLSENIDNIVEGVNKFRGDAGVSDDILIIGFEVVSNDK